MPKTGLKSWENKMPDESKNNDNENEKERGLQFAAGQAAFRPFFLGWALQSFKEVEQMDDQALAKFLKIEPANLSRLSLCRRPETTDPLSFRRDVLQIAARFGVAPASLANLLRRAEAYKVAGTAPPAHTTLLAARDHNPGEEPEQEPHPEPEDA